MTQKRVIYAACSLPAFVDMAAHLHRDEGWTPRYWIGRSPVKQPLASAFPDAVFHEHGEAIWARTPRAMSGLALPALDEPLLEQLAVCESIVLRMMDRIDYASLLTNAERRQLYYAHVRYWSAVLDSYRPDILFNVSTPHQVYDYVLQELCRLRNVPTIMFGMGFDLNLLFCKDDYRQGSGRIASIYKSRVASIGNRPVELSPDIESRLAKVTRTYSEAIPTLVANQLKDDERQSSVLTPTKVVKAGLQTLRYGARTIASAVSSDPARWKAAEQSLRDLSEWMYREVTGPLRLFKLKRYYQSLTTAADLAQPYVYVPLAYQPELSSSPEGGLFVEQVLMVDLLSKAVPPGWLVYVKEHPIQYTYTLGTNRSARSHDFYDDLKSRPNVRLLPLSTNPFALIDNAKAVATVTGTSGWEALVRGKPVLHFGYPWWQGCEGAFYTPDFDACRKALELVQNEYRVEPGKVRLFAQVTAEQSCSGDLYWNRDLHALSSKDNVRVAELVRQMAKLLGDFERGARSAPTPALAGAGR